MPNHLNWKKRKYGLYNLETNYGLFKCKPVPWRLRFFPFAIDYGAGDGKWVLHPFRPWHRWRISPCEGLDYIPGRSINDALMNMIIHYAKTPQLLENLKATGANNLIMHPLAEDQESPWVD